MACNRSEKDRKTTEEMVPPELVSVKLSEMGKVGGGGEKTVQLSDGFLRRYLRPTWFDDILVEHGAKPRNTGIVCPFCSSGSLKLLTLEPLYREGKKNERRPQDQIGNKYLYGCSNRDCHARFWANYFWEDTHWEERK